MAKSVLVLGARGFLGEHVALQLAAAGHDVLAAVRPGAAHGFTSPRISVLEGDLLDAAFLRMAIQQADAVIFCAGRTWRPGLNVSEYHRQNVAIAQAFFDALGHRPSVRVVFTSSLSTIAGSLERRMYSEDTGRDGIAELLLSPYDYAKIACENLAFTSARQGNDVVILNPGLLLGPGAFPTSNLAAPYYLLWYCQGQFTAKFHVNGGVTLSDVRDVAAAHVNAIQRGKAGNRYILGGHDMDRTQFYARVTPLIGQRMPTALPGRLLYWLMSFHDCLSFLTRGLIPSPVHRSFARTQRLYYFGASGKAASELDYTIRPIEPTILDMLQYYQARNLLPESLSWVKTATLETAPEFVLLKQLARRSGYARFLVPRLSILHQTCRANLALRQAMERLLAGSRFSHERGRFELDLACEDVRTISKFFEYAYFSSNEFLQEVL